MSKETAQLLEQHFDTAFAAPDGVAKLRELILTLAMQDDMLNEHSARTCWSFGTFKHSRCHTRSLRNRKEQ
ncbi:MAG: hypothetical protein R2684_08260 [Pyrinomonadaceae bacterium]